MHHTFEPQFSQQMTPALFRQWFYQIWQTRYDIDPTSVGVLLDSCGWGPPTGGYYWMGFEAVHSIQLVNNVLFFDNQPAHSLVSPTEQPNGLWDTLAAQFEQAKTEAHPALNDPSLQHLPFLNGWVGTVSYELNHWIEPKVPPRPNIGPFGHLYWVQCRHCIGWHSESNTLCIVSDDAAWVAHVQGLLNSLETKRPFDLSVLHQFDQHVQSSLQQDQYEERVQKVLEHIRLGDIYQANLSIRFHKPDVPLAHDFALYEALTQRNPSPFSGLFVTPVGTLVSNSPERLVRYNAGTGRLDARPIAGTRGRGVTEDEQAAINDTLKSDQKEQAEHLMLVDLERNDLGRVAAPASVVVPESFVLEQYSHVTHIVSQVEARLAEGKNQFDILRALFPGGTITGCPKVSCMNILAQLEPVPRSLYTGGLGYLDFRGHVDFNILIRSLFHWPDQRLFFHAGAGIVADSVPKQEYRECLRKTEAILKLFEEAPRAQHV